MIKQIIISTASVGLGVGIYYTIKTTTPQQSLSIIPEQLPKSFYQCMQKSMKTLEISSNNPNIDNQHTDTEKPGEDTDLKDAKKLFVQKVNESCKDELIGMSSKRIDEIAGIVFDDHKTNGEFWLKRWQLPTTKQQRAINESNSFLNCLRDVARDFIIISDTHFTHKVDKKGIADFQSTFTTIAANCSEANNHITALLTTYHATNYIETMDKLFSSYKATDPIIPWDQLTNMFTETYKTKNGTNPHFQNLQAQLYFNLISYLTTKLSPEQEQFQQVKVIEWVQSDGKQCDDFSGFISFTPSHSSGTKANFRKVWIDSVKGYGGCTPSSTTELTQLLEKLFDNYYSPQSGLSAMFDGEYKILELQKPNH